MFHLRILIFSAYKNWSRCRETGMQCLFQTGAKSVSTYDEAVVQAYTAERVMHTGVQKAVSRHYVPQQGLHSAGDRSCCPDMACRAARPHYPYAEWQHEHQPSYPVKRSKSLQLDEKACFAIQNREAQPGSGSNFAPPGLAAGLDQKQLPFGAAVGCHVTHQQV